MTPRASPGDPRVRVRALAIVLAATAAAYGCAQILGVDEDRELAPSSGLPGGGGGGGDGGSASPLPPGPGGCAAGMTSCSGTCVDLKTDPLHCGSCASACTPQPNAESSRCVDGACNVPCRDGFGHCDGNPAGPCTALTSFFGDDDGDGYGVAATTKLACDLVEAGTGWAADAGDCHDGNPQVHPGQALYFGTPYTSLANKPSYDYDCTGTETEQPGTVHFGPCGSACDKTGVAPSSAVRTGLDVNDYCGSMNKGRCISITGCLSVIVDAGTPNPCR